MRSLPTIHWILSLALIVLLTGCQKTGIYGVVTNHEGEALPGVSVQLIENGDISAVTNALGEYRLKAQSGQHTIQFAKSGYTLIQQRVEFENTISQELPTVEMWNLPANNSVFLHKNTFYQPTTWYKPTYYVMISGPPAFGTTRDPELQTDSDIPDIMCYKMPRYDARLIRLHQTTAHVPQDESQTFAVWTSANTIPVSLDPVVPSDTDLLKLNLLEPLMPGRYALHWGALEGYTTIDDRMYMFEVLENVGPLFEEADLDPDRPKDSDKPIDGDSP